MHGVRDPEDPVWNRKNQVQDLIIPVRDRKHGVPDRIIPVRDRKHQVPDRIIPVRDRNLALPRQMLRVSDPDNEVPDREARGANSLMGQVAAELDSRALPGLAELKILDPREQDSYLRHRHFIRLRRYGPPPPIDFGYSLRIRLNGPCRGPLALGYGSHFGLGLLGPVHRGESAK